MNIRSTIALYLLFLAAGVIAGLLICEKFLHRPVAAPPAIIRLQTDTIRPDSVPYTVYKGIPVPYQVKQYDTVPVSVDTVQILADYLATRMYADTLRNDTSFFLAIHETVQRNAIISREVFFQNLRPTLITNYTFEAPVNSAVYAGAYFTGSRPGVYASVIHKRYAAGAGTNGKEYVFTGSYQIFKR